MIKLALISMSLITLTIADPPDLLWSREYGGSGSDLCLSIALMDDGGFLLGGATSSVGAGRYDFCLIRTDSSGDSLWARAFGGSLDDWCESVVSMDDGTIAAAGYTNSFGAGGSDMYLVRTDGDGDTLWTRTYGGPGEDACFTILPARNGGFVLAGSTDSFGEGDYDMYLVLVDSTGDLVWQHTYGDSLRDQCFACHESTDGGYILGGITSSGDSVMLVKTDSTGIMEWCSRIHMGEHTSCRSVVQTADGGFIAGGSSSDANRRDMLLMKVDSLGSMLWYRLYDVWLYDYCNQILEAPNGDFILAGYSTDGG